MGRVLRVDHTRYKRKDGEEEAELEREKAMRGFLPGTNGEDASGSGTESEAERRPLLKEEKELDALIRDHDDDDPMKDYLVQAKKEEVSTALARLKKDDQKRGDREDKRRRHHHKHRSRRQGEGAGSDDERRRRYRRRRERSRSP